jgi:hypothetical protein
VAPTTTASTTTTTIAPLGYQPSTPTTLPLVTTPQSAHVSPAFVVASIAGFSAVLLLMLVQLFLTRPARRRRGARTL